MTSSPSPEPVISEPTTRDGSPAPARSRTLVIVLVVVAVVAAAALVLSFVFGLFTSSPAEPGSMATAGIMEVDDDASAVLVATGLAPGETADGDVVLSNVGESDGVFTLSADGLTDTPATPPLSEVLTLRVLRDGAEIYGGPLADFTAQDVGTWSPDDKQIFTFTVTVADTAGAEYTGARTELTFSWTADDS